jgi:hypothetical protein
MTQVMIERLYAIRFAAGQVPEIANLLRFALALSGCFS